MADHAAVTKRVSPATFARGPKGSRAKGWLRDAPIVAPAVVLVTVLLVAPLVLAFYFSLTDWDGFSLSPPFIGLENYRDVLTNRRSLSAIQVTATIVVVCTTVVTMFSLSLAALVKRAGRLSSFYRGVFFYPHIIAAIAIGFTWNALLAQNGPINHALGTVGIGPLPFLSRPGWALASVIGVLIWQTSALSLVLFLGAMSAVPEDLYEASSIDGANEFQKFRHITLPSIAGTITVSIVLQMARYLRVYELVLALTSGGPAAATETVAYRILSVAYANNALGRGAAEATLLFAVTLGLSIFIFSRRRSRDENL